MTHKKLIAPFITTIALTTFACSTEVIVLNSGGTGGEASTSVGSVQPTSGAGGGGGGETICPTSEPASGSACSVEGMFCDYSTDPCASLFAECIGGSWVVQTWENECNPPPCPVDKPTTGQACDVFEEGLTCFYESAWPCPGIEVQAYCDAGQWSVAEPLCNPPPPEYCYTLSDAISCEADPGCAWMVPGCGMVPKPGGASCHPAVSCLDEPWICGSDSVCATVSIDPCWNAPCAECDEPADLCIKSTP